MTHRNNNKTALILLDKTGACLIFVGRRNETKITNAVRFK